MSHPTNPNVLPCKVPGLLDCLLRLLALLELLDASGDSLPGTLVFILVFRLQFLRCSCHTQNFPPIAFAPIRPFSNGSVNAHSTRARRRLICTRTPAAMRATAPAAPRAEYKIVRSSIVLRLDGAAVVAGIAVCSREQVGRCGAFSAAVAVLCT